MLTDLTNEEVSWLISSLRKRRQEYERRRAKSKFVPEPGKRHSDEVKIERLTALEDKLRDERKARLGDVDASDC